MAECLPQRRRRYPRVTSMFLRWTTNIQKPDGDSSAHCWHHFLGLPTMFPHKLNIEIRFLQTGSSGIDLCSLKWHTGCCLMRPLLRSETTKLKSSIIFDHERWQFTASGGFRRLIPFELLLFITPAALIEVLIREISSKGATSLDVLNFQGWGYLFHLLERLVLF